MARMSGQARDSFVKIGTIGWTGKRNGLELSTNNGSSTWKVKNMLRFRT